MNVPYEKIQENQIIDQYAISLLDIAEYFRTSNPPKYKMAIKCVKVIFFFVNRHYKRFIIFLLVG